jgi:hypothetical protein
MEKRDRGLTQALRRRLPGDFEECHDQINRDRPIPAQIKKRHFSLSRRIAFGYNIPFQIMRILSNVIY